MRNRLIGSIMVMVAVMAFSPAMLAQTPARPGAGKAMPDLTGLWEVRINPEGARTICGEPACRAAAGLAPPRVFTRDAEEPLMLHTDGELREPGVHECTVELERGRLNVLVAR